MKLPTRTRLARAIAASITGLTFATPTSAVNLSQTGTGQLVIFLYYTARAGFDTLLSITNTASDTKLVLVQFSEGKHAREVLRFLAFLPPTDVFTGAVTATSEGAKFLTRDNSCTVPNIINAFPNGVSFSNAAYSATNTDGEEQGLDRAREGFLAVAELGQIFDAGYAAYAKHASNGIPINCPALVSLEGTETLITKVAAPTGGLRGSASLINVAAGTDYSYDATAIDNVSTVSMYRPPSLEVFGTGNSLKSVVLAPNSDTPIVETWPNNLLALNAVLTHANVINEIVFDTATASATDWVVTFPTKHQHIAAGTKGRPNSALPPFNEGFGKGGSCDEFLLVAFNRETVATGQPIPGLRPPQPGLCWSANVVGMVTSNVLGSNAGFFNYFARPPFENGWMSLSFSESAAIAFDGQRLAGAQTNGIRGLPVLGFMVNDFVNGTLTDGSGQRVLSNYGGLSQHSYRGR